MKTIITHISMKLVENEDKIKAYASVIINDSIKINGIKIEMNEREKLLVILPESENRRLQYVVPLTQETRQYIDKQLIDRYLSLEKALNKTATFEKENTANLKGNDTDVN